jgi:hypothetical protein
MGRQGSHQHGGANRSCAVTEWRDQHGRPSQRWQRPGRRDGQQRNLGPRWRLLRPRQHQQPSVRRLRASDTGLGSSGGVLGGGSIILGNNGSNVLVTSR